MTDDRCEYVFTIGERPTGTRTACCWRPVHGDADRCEWHLDADKEDVLIRPLRIEDDALLQEAIFRGAHLPDESGLAGRDLQRCDFSEVDLRGADLSDADLKGATFAGADLRDADFSGADISDVDFTRADLRDATLSDADARGANFERANLENASFIRTNLRDGSLRDAKLYEVLFSDTWINEGTDLGWQCIYEADENLVLPEDHALDDYGDKVEERLDGGVIRGEQSDDDASNEPPADAETPDESPADAETPDEQSDEEVSENEMPDDEQPPTDEPPDEDASPEKADTIRRNDAAAWTYRALEQLCRENALPAKTRWYYIREKDARRKQAWASGNYTSALKSEVSRWVMEYGSNPWRIIAVSLLVIVSWAFLYPLTGGLTDTATGNSFGFVVETPADAPKYYLTTVFLKSLYFSVITFATLGYGDIVPIGGAARALATVETLLGSLLTALLVFVLSRIVTW
jgi:hypothetical protein